MATRAPGASGKGTEALAQSETSILTSIFISRDRNRDRDTEIYVDIYIYFLVGLVDISLWLNGK